MLPIPHGPHGEGVSRLASIWWRDLAKVEELGGENWFKSEVVRKMGDGLSTSFWRDRWRTEIPLMHLFPRLFSISDSECSVGEVLSGREGGGRWNLVWRRDLFVWETELVENLGGLLEGVLVGEGRESGGGGRRRESFLGELVL